MVAVLLKDKTGIFDSLSQAVAFCGLITQNDIVKDDYRALCMKIRDYYSVDDLFKMGLEDCSCIPRNQVFEIPDT